MLYRWVIWIFPVMVFSTDLSWKLVLDGDKNIQKAQIKLLKAQIVFLEDTALEKLQKKYQLKLKIDSKSGYNLIVIKPIRTESLQKILQVHMSRYFPDLLCIEDTVEKSKGNMLIDPKKTSLHKVRKKPEKVLGIGIEWIAILLLSILGLLVSFYNRYKIKLLKMQQKTMDIKQDEIEQEIKRLEK